MPLSPLGPVIVQSLDEDSEDGLEKERGRTMRMSGNRRPGLHVRTKSLDPVQRKRSPQYLAPHDDRAPRVSVEMLDAPALAPKSTTISTSYCSRNALLVCLLS